MQIFNQEPDAALWDIVSPLKKEIPIFKEGYDEDCADDREIKSYLLLRTDITDRGKIYGDGDAQIRKSECDIILVSKGVAAGDCLHNRVKKKVKRLLKSKGIDYQGHNLGYNASIKSTEYTWSVQIFYVTEKE